MSRLVALTLFSLAALAPAQEPKPKPKLYKTPQAVFDAAMAAHARNDFKTAVACLSPEAQEDTASALAYAALNVKEGNTDEIRKAFEPLFAVMDKHGLTAKAVKDVALGDDAKTTAKSRETLRKMIKKPADFAAEYLAAQDKLGAGEKPGETKTKLSGVSIDGDKATGTVSIDYGGTRELVTHVGFVKIGGGWRYVPEPRKKAK